MQPKHPALFPAVVEALEARQLLSSVSMHHGLLTVVANKKLPNHVVLSLTPDNKKIHAVVTSGPHRKVSAMIRLSRVTQIRVMGGNAGDLIEIDPNLTVPADLRGGTGNDTLLGGGGNDTLDGTAGDDTLDGRDGYNVLYQDSASDQIQSTALDTVVQGYETPVNPNGTPIPQPSPAPSPGPQPSGGSSFSMADTTMGPTGSIGLGGFDIRSAMTLPTAWSSTTTKDLTGATNLDFSLTSQVQNPDGSLTQIWSTAGGVITATAVLSADGDTRDAQLTVTNNSAVRLHQLNVDMPYIYAPATSARQVLTGYRGGSVSAWPQSGSTEGNSSEWPNMGYSPVAIFYDKTTTEGVGFTAFNDKLLRTTLSWETNAQLAAPHAKFLPELAAGSSATFHLQLRHQTIGMPDAHLLYYRNNFLAPFMASQGIPEAQYRVGGPGVYWGYVNGWSLPDGTMGPTPSAYLTVAQNQQALGARGFVEWGQPNQTNTGILPYSSDQPWTSALPSVAGLGLTANGVLINPFITGPASAPSDWFTTGYSQDFNDPAVQSYLQNYKQDLLNHNVNFAYWDTGADPRNGDGLAWLHLMADWKQSGITIAPESSCDVAAWATGANLNYPYQWNDLVAMRVVTPNATQFAIQQADTTHVVNGATVYWWQDAIRQGVVPILTDPQLQEASRVYSLPTHPRARR